jgi:formamidopyrimidine-DNA glycosylase
MPELPEVECVRRALQERIVGAKVHGAKVLRRDVIVAPADPPGGWTRRGADAGKSEAKPIPAIKPTDLLVGLTINRLERHGKQLAIIAGEADRARVLIVQLGMTGQLLVHEVGVTTGGGPSSDHVHLRLDLRTRGRTHGLVLEFRDPRRFGCVRIARSTHALDARWRNELGPDALTISATELAAGLFGTKRAIKAVLLDQAVIAGVGNIYADEALFESGLSPRRRAGVLGQRQVARLAVCIRRVLVRAIKAGGSTLRDYVRPDGAPGSYQLEHRVYGRGGLPCVRCGCVLRSAMFAQRTTVWCPECQS